MTFTLKDWDEIDLLVDTDPLELRDYCWELQRKYVEMGTVVTRVVESIEERQKALFIPGTETPRYE